MYERVGDWFLVSWGYKKKIAFMGPHCPLTHFKRKPIEHILFISSHEHYCVFFEYTPNVSHGTCFMNFNISHCTFNILVEKR